MEKRPNHACLTASRYFLLLFAFAFSTNQARGADIQIVRLEEDDRTATIRLPKENFYKEGDTVCAYQKSQQLTCGDVVSSQGLEATVIFPEDGERPLVGDRIGTKDVIPSESPAPREEDESLELENKIEDDSEVADAIADDPQTTKKVTAHPHVETTEQEDRRKELVRYHRSKIKRRYASNDDSLGRTFLRQTFGFSVGAAIYGESGTNNLWPNGLVQFALGRTTTLGVQAGYFTFGGNSVTGTSYYATVNYHYYPYEAFVGPTGRVGIGMASTNYTATSGLTNTTGTTTPIMAVGSIGWRWLTDSRINIGLEAGFHIQQLSVQTYFSSTAANSSITFFLPMIQLDIGYAF